VFSKINYDMNSTKSAAAMPGSTRGLTGRSFSKAKVLAQRLGVCPGTIFRWADDGMISRHKINARVVLFDEQEVAAFLDSSRV